MKKLSKIALILTLLLTINLLLSGCGGNSGSTKESYSGSSEEKIDLTEFAKSIGPPLSPEDAAIDITAKSSNPNKVIWRAGFVNRNLDEVPTLRADRQFFIEMKKRLGDKVEFQLYFGGTLGTSADQILGGLQNRNFESYAYNVGAFAEYTNAFMPLDVMFLIPDTKAGAEIVAGEPGKLMKQKCIEDTGLNVLYMGAIGMRHITNSVRPIKSVEDLKGLKIRVQNNPLHILAFKALGAAPTPIAYAELFTSLQQGVVDGQENPISNIFEQNFGEVQRYMTLTNHLYTAGATVINNDWLLEQSEEFQKAVAESAAIAQAYSYPDLVNTEDKMLEMLRKQMEVIELNEEEMAKFIEISKGTWDEAAKIIGADYFNSIKEAIERMGY